MGQLFNRVYQTVASAPGTGAATLGSAVSGYQTFAAAGATNGALVSYLLQDGTSWEYGLGTYSTTGPTLTRTTILGSSNSGSAISASSSATVMCAPLASDIVGASFGFVNKFRNGPCDVAQRGTSGSVSSGSTAYTLDGIQITATGAAAAWSQVYGSNLAGNSLKIAAASGLTACTWQQRIESYIASEMLTNTGGAQAITAQWAIYNGTSSAITPQIAAGYASAQDNFITVTSDLAATSLSSIPASSAAVVAYTWTPSTSLSNGYQIQLLFGGGLNASSGYVQVSRADIRATPGLSAGINFAPPPPEMRPIQSELAFCQRYYYDPANGGSTVALEWNAYSSGSGAQGAGFIAFPVTMRASPTVAYRNQTYSLASTMGSNTISPAGVALFFTFMGTGSNAGASFNLTASAEL